MRRSTLVLLIAVGALAVILVIQRVNTGGGPPTVAEWTADADRIIIEKPDATLTLQKSGDGWVVTEEEYPADDERVKRILDELKTIGQVEVVSSGKNYERYDLTKEKSIRVTVYSGENVLRDVLVGKNSSVGRKSYARQADEQEVLLIDRSVRRAVDTTVADIRDKTIMDIAESSVQEITLRDASGRSILLTPKPAENDQEGSDAESTSSGDSDELKWDAGGDVSDVDMEAIGELFRNLTPLTARSFDADQPEEEPLAMMSITMRNGREHRLAVFPHEKEQRFTATADTVQYPFVLGRRTVESLFLGERMLNADQ